MTRIAVNHPDVLLAELISKGGRPLRLRNLNSIHEICRSQYEAGSRNISISSIGKLCESAGILKARGLYNAPLTDYRKLILCWSEFTGTPVNKPVRELASEEYINRIDDPAIRAMVQRAIAERNKLRAQLNTIKSNTKVIIDRRPVHAGIESELQPNLTNSERTALTKAISQKFLESNNWREVDLGEIVNSRGMTVFDPGFATAIRKIIGE
jgi:hypothetical protein